MAESSIGFTVFLLKSDQVAEFQAKFPATSGVGLSGGIVGYFIPMPSEGAVPQWAVAVTALLQTVAPPDLQSQRPSALLVIERGARTYVLTFGHAWQLLEDDWLEPDFGRRVALNLITKGSLIEIRTEQVFANWHVASDRSPRAASVEEFGVEFDRDLVAVVEGLSSKKEFGKTVRGGTSLRLNIPISTLVAVLGQCEGLFLSNEYRNTWPEIDNLTPVKNRSLVNALDHQLDLKLANGSALDQLVMFTPTYRRDDPLIAESYVFGHMGKSPARAPYLTVTGWTSHLLLRGMSRSVDSAKATKVHLLDSDGNDAKACTAYECFGYELGYSGRQYVLSSGMWYEASVQFIKRINDTVSKLQKPNLTFPNWDGKEKEGAYNERCAAQDKSLLFFDAKNVMLGGGQSKFEFCDLFHPETKTLIFAKIVSRSSGMSHLVEQVRRATDLTFSPDPAFRTKLKKVFKKEHPKAERAGLDTRPKNADWNLCLVSLGRSATTLPFFAKCSLINLYDDMRQRGHDLFFASV
jgi:uncharacterized protein (TIGR04141 family)